LTQTRTTQDPLVHHGCHFGCAIHAFCNVQTLVTNSIFMMGEMQEQAEESFTAL
ncbi:hypothetical protein BJ138DRAFT_1018088, partial [Hygrophoropsis aurantiaca]